MTTGPWSRDRVTTHDDPALAGLVVSYAGRRPGWVVAQGRVQVTDDELLVPGRPGIHDVVADVSGTIVHLPIGLRNPGDEVKVLGGVEEPVLGLHDDPHGVAVAFDAVRDAETASMLLHAVTGRTIDSQRVRQVRFDTSSATLAFDDRLDFTIFDRLADGAHAGLELLVGLDSVGFNHVAAPVAVWRRGGRDLGVVQEHLVGGSSGWAMARTSVRDLYAARVAASEAGGDFASEARRLGGMTARMHLALAEAFGSDTESIASTVDAVESHVGDSAPELLDRDDVRGLIAYLRDHDGPLPVVRAHGDFHLGRVWRAEQGWMVVELSAGEHPVNRPGGVPGDADLDAVVGPGPTVRSPLADAADMVWTFREVAQVAAARRDPAGREDLGPLADEWQARNRQAFLAGYREVERIGDIIPADSHVLERLVGLFELDRVAGRLTRRREP